MPNPNPLTQIPTLLLLLLSITTTQSISVTIPLTYAFDPDQPQKKYPIKLSFNSSHTTTPFISQYLPLYGINITMQTIYKKQSQYVTIGLKNPSTFLTSIKKLYNIENHQIEIDKDKYTQLILNNNNFVSSTDQFINGGLYTMKAVYNYGEALQVRDQKCILVDSEDAVFDQFLILEILNTMDKRNKIKYTKNQIKNVIEIEGNIENFPKISFQKDKSIFEVQIKLPTLHYTPRTIETQPITYIGYKSLTKFSKFRIEQTEDNHILFKRTSQLYQLYLFLGYFFVFTIVFIIVSRREFEESMKFVRSVIDWAVFHNQEARVRVLRTQLE